MEELRLENVEFIENKDLTLEDKIRIRLEELNQEREQTIETLKVQQQLALGPFNLAIAELTNLLPKKEA
jgi:hypothetical protein